MASVTNSMSFFFYIKGSTDYPVGQLIDQNFGYDKSSSSETAIFDYSVKDIYNKITNPKVIDNIYSLSVSSGMAIPSDSSYPSKSYSADQEYISSMIVQNGDTTGYNHIIPNYTESDINNLGLATTHSVGGVDVYYREPVFWQKMFQLFEYIKGQESNIALSTEPTYTATNYTDNENFSTYYNAETVIGKYLALFIGGDHYYDNNEYSNGINLYRSQYTGIDGTDSDSAKYERLWKTLGIRYIPESASSYTSGDYEGRVNYIRFSVAYTPVSGGDETIWTFKIYLTPGSFITNSVTTQYKVYTYNDSDLSDQYADTSTGFNIYDNDYAHTLLKSSESYNNFTVSNNEMQSQIIDELTTILKTGAYDGYVKFSTIRVSPYISNGEVLWTQSDSSYNRTTQIFYIFYNAEKPSASDQQDAIRSYLRNLHSSCSSETLNKDGTVKFIGHRTTTTEITNFLAKMYPSLFSEASITIIPCLNTSYTGSDPYDPTAYLHPLTLANITNMMKTVSTYSGFLMAENGVAIVDSGTQTHFPVEIFHMGGAIDENGSQYIKYDFPLIATQSGNNVQNPLTSIDGFENYKQKMFTTLTSAPTSTVDLFQFILLMLYKKSFEKGNTKARYSSIGGIDITYSFSSTYDDSFAATDLVYNVAYFTLASVQFVVYSQIGKNFGSSESTESIVSE